jgi:hypothetical protein
LTNKQAADLAKYNGYETNTKQYTKANQPIFSNGKEYISQDVTSHNGGTWKKAKKMNDLNSKDTRSGTYDALLTKIGE